MRLFFITAVDHEDYPNMDLFVWAKEYADAVEAWKKYYDDWDFPEAVKLYVVVPGNCVVHGAIPWNMMDSAEVKL